LPFYLESVLAPRRYSSGVFFLWLARPVNIGILACSREEYHFKTVIKLSKIGRGESGVFKKCS
jgi:hypothetical protein